MMPGVKTFRDGKGAPRLRWSCPLCPHHWDFHTTDLEHVSFFAIHHLADRHQLGASEILDLLPDLLDAVNAYPGRLPVQGPS